MFAYISGNYLKNIYLLSRGVELIWVSSAVVLIMFALDLFPYGRQQTADSANLLAQNQVIGANAASSSSLLLAQATSQAVGSGQVKAINTVTISPSRYGTASLMFPTPPGGCYYPGCPPPVYSPEAPPPQLAGATYPNTYYKNYTSWVTFPLSAIPVGQTIFSASLGYAISAGCNVGTTVSVYGYQDIWVPFYSLKPIGQGDPYFDSYRSQYTGWMAAGAGYSTSPCAQSGSSLGGLALGHIYQAKAAVDRFSFAIIGTGPWVMAMNPGSFSLSVTYGTPELDLKINGGDGPITVAKGSNLSISWSSVGYDSCTGMTYPPLYTPAFKIGAPLPLNGGASNKAYMTVTSGGAITYSISCRNSATGAAASDSVQVNITP